MSYSGPPRPTGPGSYFDMFKQQSGMGGNFPNQQKFGFFGNAPYNAPPPMVPHRFTRPTIHFNVPRKEFTPQAAAADGTSPLSSLPPTATPSSSTVPITTVFVGNITTMEKCSDELVQKILTLCGTVNNWKRLQDSNGKFSPFGFCDFDHPDGTRRALRILNGHKLGDKKLTVKADEATSKLLEEFARNREAALAAKSEAPEEEGSEAPPSALTDDEIREKIKEELETADPDLLNVELAPEEATHAGEARPRSNSSLTSSSASTRKSKHSEKKAVSAKHHSSRDAHRRPDGSSKRDRHGRSDSESGSRSSSVSHTSSRPPSSKRKRDSSSRHGKRSPGRHGRRHQRRSSSRSSVDSEEMRERRRLRKEIKEKEASYLRRLEKWEQREKRTARKYDKDEEEDLQRRKMIQREARKLKQFLEDYEDERDDPKYYKSSALFQRRRNYEKEREADAKDRQEELQEIDELKRQIMAEKREMGDEDAERQAHALHEANEKARLRHVRSHSGSPTPHRPLGHAAAAKVAANAAAETNEPTAAVPGVAEGEMKHEGEVKAEWSPVNGNGDAVVSVVSVELAEEAPKAPVVLSVQQTGAKPVVATIQKQSIASTRLNGVFGDEDDDEEDVHKIKKKIRPFEITKEDRIQSLTSEERKKLVKELIEKIPTGRDELFIFAICWAHVDVQLVEQRIKPWINKKISEYIGEEEPSLVSFICEKIAGRTDPKKILSDLAMVLDDEAEVFMLKLWRLIIYESEAKRLGLSSASSSASMSGVMGGAGGTANSSAKML